jgi:hypothetical protein
MRKEEDEGGWREGRKTKRAMGMGFGGVPFIYWADDKRGLKGGRRDDREEITKRGGRRPR